MERCCNSAKPQGKGQEDPRFRAGIPGREQSGSVQGGSGSLHFPDFPRSTLWFDTTPCLPEHLLRVPWLCATYPEILLKDDFGGVEGAQGVDVHHCLEGVEGQGTGWAQEVPRST